MKSLKYLMIALLLLSITLCNAQSKNQKTESVKIYGNCEMCESTIEKTGNMKNQSNVDWNKETKIATISYDSLKTSKEEILKRIAFVGYDSDTFLSPDDTYSNLPSCCQYERAKKEIVSSEEPKMKIPIRMTESDKTNYLKLVFDSYFAVKNALVSSDGNLTSIKSTELVKSIENVKMNELKTEVHMGWMKVMKELKGDANKMAKSKDENSQRTDFISLSNNMYSLLKIAKYEEPVYYQFCPMANNGKGANWLSTEYTIKNPYYGSAMLSCGKTVETIKIK